MKGVNQKNFGSFLTLAQACGWRLYVFKKTDQIKAFAKTSSIVMTVLAVRKKHLTKILFTNQRPPEERWPGHLEGPSSHPQLCWWPLI
jgi:hypothetical protein